MLFICKKNYICVLIKIKDLQKIKKERINNPFEEHGVFLFWIQV